MQRMIYGECVDLKPITTPQRSTVKQKRVQGRKPVFGVFKCEQTQVCGGTFKVLPPSLVSLHTKQSNAQKYIDTQKESFLVEYEIKTIKLED
jgi:hypothetical protein